MRRLVLLALVALAAFPLSAHGHGHRSRRVVVVEDAYRPSRDWDDDRWEHHGYGHRGHYSRNDFYGVTPFPVRRRNHPRSLLLGWIRKSAGQNSLSGEAPVSFHNPR